jgi:hypothetical protein
MKIPKSLRESVICTVVLAALRIGCGGKSVLTILPGAIASNVVAGVRSFTHPGGSIGATRSGQRSIAAFFQSGSPAPSVLPESWQAGCADLANSSFSTPGRYALLTTETGTLCGDTTSGGTAGVLLRDSPTATDVPDGPEINFDGTLAAVVVTAQVDGLGEIRCNDIVNTSAIHDGNHIQPWYDQQQNAVVFTSEHVVIANTCTLPGLQTGAVGVHKIVVKFAKI